MSTSRRPTDTKVAGDRPRRRARRLFTLMAALIASLVLAVYGTWAVTNRIRSTAAADEGVPLDPSAFATGACVAYPPTAGDRHRTVFLDAGHGGPDPGAIGVTSSGQTVDEATETLPVELDTAADLRRDGYRVVVSRTTDSSVARLTPADKAGTILSLQGAHDDVAARDQCANAAGAAVLIGIYFDSGGSPDDGGSVTTYDTVRPFSAGNLKLATLVQTDVLAAMNGRGWDIPDDGVQPDSEEGSIVPTDSDSPIAEGAAAYGHVLLLGPPETGFFATPSQMPGALIEPLFVTDPFEGTLSTEPVAQHVIAGGIADAVNQYFAPAARSH